MYDKPIIMRQVKPGDRFRAQPYTQMARTRGMSSPVQLPYTVPATAREVNDDAGRLEYVTGEIDADLYGHRPWQSDRQLWVISRDEIHSIDCRCRICS
ncbi:hypothetical protein [Micromonospora sp. NPDC005652]|uniref:hypothetical protein n=1 Tax=Micromonospora sp. NPDC005652 TaxID=3157046 RepID=UPI0033C6F395